MKATPIFTTFIPSPIDLGCRRKSIIYIILRVYTASWKALLQLHKVCHWPLSWCHKWIFKQPFHHSISPVTLGWGQGKTDEFHEHGSIALFHFYTKTSFCRRDAMWITTTEDKPFCKSMDGGFGINFIRRERKYIEKVSISVRTDYFSSHEGSDSTVINGQHVGDRSP